MAWFKRKLRATENLDPAGNPRPDWMTDDMMVTLYEGDEELEVVGESYYQSSLWLIVGGERNDRVREECAAVLSADQDNEYDANAISVWVSGLKVGHLSRSDAAAIRPGLLDLRRESGKPVALAGVIVGGGLREDRRGLLGVFLRYDPTRFGLEPIQVEAHSLPTERGSMRTGLSNAIATDDKDESYDLSWLGTLPQETTRAVQTLYDLLADDEDPIDRHYMMSELERRLYRARNSFTSALDDYDAMCIQHDKEMDVIAAAFVEKWEAIPLLETYKQQSIRRHKAGDFAEGLWWASRGIEVYGGMAARQEWVEDLEARIERFKTKMDPSKAVPVASTVVSVEGDSETLRCVTCGSDFARTRTRGRKPHECPHCRSQTA